MLNFYQMSKVMKARKEFEIEYPNLYADIELSMVKSKPISSILFRESTRTTSKAGAPFSSSSS